MKKLKWMIYGVFERIYCYKAARLVAHYDNRDPDRYGDELQKCIDKLFFWSSKKVELFH